MAQKLPLRERAKIRLGDFDYTEDQLQDMMKRIAEEEKLDEPEPERKPKISEAATKKKRGRPPTHPQEIYDLMFPDEERRPVQNKMYAYELISLLDERGKAFFVTDKGKFRRQGIAEKIGRMYSKGLITDDESRSLAADCMKDYENGEPVKQIEKRLALLRDSIYIARYKAALELMKGGETDPAQQKNPPA